MRIAPFVPPSGTEFLSFNIFLTRKYFPINTFEKKITRLHTKKVLLTKTINKMKKTTLRAIFFMAILFLGFHGLGWGATPYVMSGGNYLEDFTNIANTTSWPAGFNGTDCTEWGYVAVNATGTIPDGLKTTVSTATFSTGTSGGIQRGSANIYFLSTGSTDNSNACAIEVFLDFTGRNAGTLSFDWAEVNNSTGDRKSSLKVYTSTDGTTYTELTGAAVLNVTNNVASSGSISAITLPASFNNSSTARIRFYEYNATGGTTGSRAKISVDNVAVTSTSAGTPSLSVAPGTLTGFGYVYGASTSPSQYYDLSGSYLTYPGSVSIAGSTNYEVSTDDINYGSSASITLTSSTLAATHVYVRLKLGLSVGNYNTETIGNSGAGVSTPVNVTCSGSVTSSSTITVGTITAFGDQAINTLSAEKTYNVSGSGLTSDIVITAPTGFQISTGTGGSFVSSSPISLPQSGGIVNSTAIYVKFAPTIVQAYSGNITHTSTNATQQNVAVSGNGTAAPATLPFTETFNYTSPGNIGGNGNAGSISNNWTTHSVTAGQTTTIDVISGSLSYTGLAASTGNKVYSFGSANTMSRDVNTAITTTATTAYYSALINIVDNSGISATTPDYFMHFGATAGTSVSSFGGRLSIKSVNTGANYRLSIQNISTGTPTFTEFATDLNFGTTYLIVVKYDRNASPTVASLWVNPSSLGGTEPAGAVVNSSGTGTFAAFASICLRNNATTPKAYIDEIRVGTTWADVTPATPNLSVTPGTLSNLNYVQNSGPSTSQYYDISGSNLTYPGSISIAGSTNYEVSTDDVNFGASASITLTSSTLAATHVWVHLKAGLTSGDYNGETVGNSGAGVTTPVYVTCSGTVSAAPLAVLTVDPTSLSGFTYSQGTGPSPSQHYDVSGSNLTYPGSISIAGSTNYEVSTDDITFGSSASITLTSSTLAATPVYVHLKSGLAQGTYSGETVGNSGAGITTPVTVGCSGSVSAPTTVNIAPGGNVLETFTIGTTATAALPTGWRADKQTSVALLGTYAAALTATSYAAGDSMSTSASNGIYNFGAGPAGTATDRAVGGISSSSGSKTVNVYAKVHNTGTIAIPSLNIGYDVEKYRKGSNVAGFSVQMYYSTDDVTYTSAGPDFLTSFSIGGDMDNYGYKPAPGVTTSVPATALGLSIPAGGNIYLAWSYSVASGTTTTNAQALGIDNVAIEAGTTELVALPSFAPPAGTYYTTQNITITCSTPGATIHYTTDGNTPTESSDTYSGPIELTSGSGTTVIKARAYLSGMSPSSVASAAYYLPPVVEVSNVLALRSGSTDGTVYRLTGEAIVTYFRTTIGPATKQAYVQDGTAAIMIYDVALIINTYVIGDGITGLTGRLQNYNQMIEFIPLTNPGLPTHQNLSVTPTERTLVSLTSADQAKLIKVVNTTFTGASGNFVINTNYPITDGTASRYFRTLFSESNYIGKPIKTTPVNLVALVTEFGNGINDTIRLTSRDSLDITAAAPLWTATYPKVENPVPDGFTAKVNINTTGTAYLVVLPNNATPVPNSAQVKAGQNGDGNPLASNLKATISCAAGSTEYTQVMSGLSNATDYDVYFVAEASGQLQSTPVKVDATTAAAPTIPVLTTPTVASVTETSAVLGGTISSNGGSPILERGTVWSTSTPVYPTDNMLAEGGTALGAFTQLRETLTTGVTIHFAAYARNAVGTGLSPEGSFLTLVAEPTNNASNFTAGIVTQTIIPLSWTDALPGDVAATGYLIKGSTVSFSAIADPVDGVEETSAGLVQNVNAGIESYSMIGLTAGVTYYFKIYSYNTIGSTSINYKVGVDVPTVSATTPILLNEPFNYTIGEYVGGPPDPTSNNWTAHSGVGTIPVMTGNLSYTGLATSTGGKIYVPGINSAGPGQVSKDINRPLSTTSTVIYYSAIVNVLDSTQLSATANDYFLMIGATAGTTVTSFGARLGITKANVPASAFRLSISNFTGGTPNYTQLAQDLSFGTPHLVVVKLDRSVTPCVATLWVDPNPIDLGEAEPAGSVSNNSGTTAFGNFASICIRNGGGTPKAEYDEIRVGTTWAMVTPKAPSTKTLNLSSVFMEGLYAGSNTMNQALDIDLETGNAVAKWADGVADTITVELHDSTAYAYHGYETIIYKAISIPLLTGGTATVTVPSEYNSAYYVTIKHRNHLETTSALPVVFTDLTSIDYAFDAQDKAYGNNMGLMIDLVPVIFAGDENQDGAIEGFDLAEIGNAVDAFGFGYIKEDIDGNAGMDGFDLAPTGNNSDAFVAVILP
jgi:hypothetical protein